MNIELAAAYFTTLIKAHPFATFMICLVIVIVLASICLKWIAEADCYINNGDEILLDHHEEMISK